MLETPSFAISSEMPCSCEQEGNWMYDGLSLTEMSNIKRKSEDGDKLGNSLKVLKLNNTEDMEVDFLNLSLSLGVNQSNNHSNNGESAGDNSDTSSLIPQLGPDSSVECLARCSRSDYSSIAQLNHSFRSLTQSNELYNLRRKLGIVEHWIYISCSLCEWQVFDSIRCRRRHLPSMPNNDCFMHSDKESLAVGTDLLVFGKGIDSHLIYKYSLLTNSWSTGMEMNTPRCLFGSATLGEIAIFAGGCDVWGNIFSSAELYNSRTGTWETLPSMSKPRKKCSAVFMDGKFYVIGGLGVRNTIQLKCGEVFDLESRTWTEIPDMLPPRNTEPGARIAGEAPPLLTVVNNELYAADHGKMEVKKYIKSSNSWVIVGSLPEKIVSVSGWGLAFRGCGNRLIVIGGARSLDRRLVEVNAWDPSQSPQVWELIGYLRGNFVYNCAIMGC